MASKNNNSDDNMITMKTRPFNKEAENSILGAILLNNDICNQAVELLRDGDDFFLSRSKIIFSTMVNLYNQGSTIDLITLGQELRQAGKFEMCGGATGISSLIDGVPRADNIKHWADIVKKLSSKRKIQDLCGNLLNQIDDGEELEEIVEAAESGIYSIGDSTRRTNGPQHIADIGARLTDFYEEKSANPSALIGLSTGYTDIDARTLGLTPGVTMIAARTSMGKTALAVNIACNVAIRGFGKVYYASLESGAEKIAQRVLASESRIDSYRMRQGRMTPDEWVAMSETLSKLAMTRFVIDDDPDVTPASLIARCRQFATQNGGIDLVIVDYLQMMVSEDNSEGHRDEVRRVSKGLVKLSRVLNVPVLALAQLSREVDKRPGHRPQKSDLSDSSALEKDADILMFILRDEEYVKTDKNKNKATIIFGKMRDGATENDVHMSYINKYTRFETAWRDPDDNSVYPGDMADDM